MKSNLKCISVLVISLLLMLTVSCTPDIRENQSRFTMSPYLQVFDEDLVKLHIARMDIKYNTLGFKGLHLGMTSSDVRELINETPWFDEWFYEMNRFSSCYDTQRLHKTLEVAGRDTSWFKRIGCKGSKKRICYYFDRAYLTYFDDKIVGIDIKSPEFTADEINTGFKNWGRFALKGLIRKYGKQNITLKSIEDVNIFSFESGNRLPLYVWDKGNEAIILCICECESTFYYYIWYIDKKGMESIKKDRAKIKSEF